MSDETVSVVIPAWNAERHLGPAIRSALAQTWPRVEVVVVDDGSTDGTRELAEAFGERVRVLTGPRGGVARARNRGLEASRGDPVHFLDADDVLPAGVVAEKMALFALYPDAAGVASRCFVPYEVDFDETIALPEGYRDLVRRGRLSQATRIGGALGLVAPPSTPILFRRHALLDAGGFDPAMLVQENVELTVRMILGGARILYVDTIGLVYRNDRRIPRLTDAETYTSPAFVEATRRFLTMLDAHDALATELGDEMFAWIADAGHVASVHGALDVADAWFALADRIRPGALAWRGILRPVVRFMGPARASRLDRRLRHVARKVGLSRRPSRRRKAPPDA